ncbi:MAG: ribulose-phosphate 3-epimerase [Balneolia bacterium]|nr:ribulose-phosphate 3-epimerase [Balneolia bacterium]
MKIPHPLSESYSFPTIAPSILAADYTKLGEDISACTESGVKWIHCDIMDGHFVPNISYGSLIVNAARRAAPDAFLDVHLMIYNPDRYIADFAKAGANLISVHAEADPHIHRTLGAIKELGLYRGVAINPGTPLTAIEEVLPEVDLVCVMSVNPGFGGQKFIPSALQKIERLVKWRQQMGLNFLIEIDGGIGLANTENVAAAGTDVLVAGSSVFGAEDKNDQIQKLFQKAIIGSSNLT